jgi:signal transduction histidine kinase
MTNTYSSKILIMVLVLTIFFIGYLDHVVGFGFHLFPLYLIPLAIVAWKQNLKTTIFLASLAGLIIIFKIFLTKDLYANSFFWYWDGLVKFSLLIIMSYGLWSIRHLTLQRQKQDDAKINELNASLKVQIEQLKATNRELEDFSYTISHDLRAPIRHINGFVDLLNSRDLSSLDEKSRHYLKVITEAGKKMGDLIDGLLAYSQLGRTELIKTRIDFNRLVRDIVQKLAEETKGRVIEWDIAPLPTLVGDAGMLRQVMVNLIANALKFTQPRSRTRIEIGTLDKADETLIYVRDNGVGFDIRYVNKLFGMFQRLHSAEEFEGTGVGLANVQRIIVRHGGRVWAEGEVDSGATIWFSLPKTESDSQEPS